MKLTPHVRIISAVLVSSVVLLIPSTIFVLIPLPAILWLLICKPDIRTITNTFKIGALFFLPLFIFLPWIKNTTPLLMSIRGFSLLLIGMSTIATISQADIIPSLSSIPMPAVVRMIIMQILYQTGTLQNETVRMAQALKVRNISTTIALRRSLIFKWPAAWLLRVLVRAERVSNAMEIRDYSCFIAKNYALITTKIDIVFMFVLLFVCILTGIGRIYG